MSGADGMESPLVPGNRTAVEDGVLLRLYSLKVDARDTDSDRTSDGVDII